MSAEPTTIKNPSDASQMQNLEYLVIDSGAIIRGHSYTLSNHTKRVCTIQEVINEIRDSKSRNLLDLLPYTLEIMSPSDSAMKAVIDFSKKTGDFAVLSLTDLKLIALMYTLEASVNGSEKLMQRASNYKKVLDTSGKPTATKKSTNNPAAANTNTSPTSNGKTSASDNAMEMNHVITSIGDDGNCGCGSTGPHELSSDGHQHEVADYVEDEVLTEAKNATLADSEHIEGDEVDMDQDGCENESLGDDNESDIDEDDEVDEQNFDDDDGEMTEEAEDSESSENNGDSIDNDYDEEMMHEQSQLENLALANSVSVDPINEVDQHDSPPVEFNLDEDFPTLSGVSVNIAPAKESAILGKKWNIIAASAPVQGTVPRKIVPTIVPLSLYPEVADPSSSSSIGDSIKNSSMVASLSHFTSDVSNSEAMSSVEITSKPFQPSSSRILTGSSNAYTGSNASGLIAEEDDNQGWINVGNISSFRANGLRMDSAPTSFVDANAPANGTGKRSKSKPTAPVKTACITTDFSMQNVMFQLGLNLMSIEGMLIQKVKQWVLRCVGCFQIHYEMDRLFCSKCGGSVLTRVAVSIDKRTGNMRLHLKQNYQVNLRGTKYSLPGPGQKSGKHDAGLLLREDQLLTGIWKQKLNAMKSKVKQSLGGDSDLFSAGDVGFQPSKLSSVGGGLSVGYGKKNPNAMKGRERRGKKKRN